MAWRIVSALLLALLLLPGCERDLDVKLPGNYVLMRTETLPKDLFLIAKGDESIAVPYSVVEVAVRGTLVIGHVEKAPPPGFEDEPNVWTAPGYFVWDTASGAVRLGLTEADWIADLKARGIDEKPRLAISPGFDRRSSAYR